MGFLSGNIACTRFNIISLPDEPAFQQQSFQLIQPGSNFTESSGFIPFEIEEPYTLGKNFHAFRVRIDKINIDATLLKERLRELIKLERDRGEKLGSKKIRNLKRLAQDELLSRSAPRSKVIEGVIRNQVLYVGSTSKSHLGTVLALLQKIGVEVEYKTPWFDLGMEENEHPWLDLKEPGQSIFGSRFLKALFEEHDFMVEPEKGSIKLATPTHARVSLTGEVLGELDHYLEEGAEILAAKLIFEETPMAFDGLSYRINSIKLERFKGDHWSEVLELRLDRLQEVWEAFDTRFSQLKTKLQVQAAIT